jgi:ligand-binding sensor domain-containing protein
MKRLPPSDYFFTALLFLICSTCCMSQKEYSFRHIGVENGLSQGSIYHMQKDSRGFLWLGTQDGINRYDGKNIKVYLSGATGESTNIIGIAEDSLSNLWVGSHKGCYQYVRKHNRFERPNLLRGLENVSVYVFSDRGKRIYFLSEKGLYTVLKGTLTLITNELTYSRSQYNNFLTETADGNLWLIDARSGLKCYAPQFNKVYSYYSDRSGNMFGEPQTFNCITVDRSDALWLASRDGLFKFDAHKNKMTTYDLRAEFSQHNPTDIKEDHDGRLWLATEGNGIFIYDPVNEKTIQHLIHEDDNPQSLRFNEIGNLYVNDNNDIFVNTDPQGLDILSEVPSAFKFYGYGNNQDYNLSDYSVRGLAEDADATIWAGTELGGVNRLNPKTGKIAHYSTKNGLPNNTIRYILKDKRDVIWVASINGLARFHPPSNRFVIIPLPVSCEISNMISMDDDRLLLSSNKGLMILSTASNRITSYAYPDLIAGYGSHWDQKTGLAYVTNRYRGVKVFEMRNNQLVLKTQMLQEFHVLQILRDPESPVLWVCTDQGLVKWDMQTNRLIKNYRIADGLHHEFLYCILPDSYGYFWLSTNRGITRFNPKTATFELIKEITPREYNSRSALVTKNGDLYFGSTSGLDLIKPRLLSLMNDHVGVQLTDLIHDRKDAEKHNIHLSEQDEVRLSYDENTFILNFTATDFRSGGLNRFRYFLKGYDKDTIYAENDDPVRYARLPAGQYEFQLQASDLRGNWVSEVKKLKIEVLPPFWQTWVFILFIALFLIAASFIAIKTYLNSKLTAQKQDSERQISLEKERSRIARDMNDGLGSELFGLKLLGQVALSQNKNEGTESSLQKIVAVSKSISEKISEIIWVTDSNQDNAESLWSYIQKNALIYLKPSGISYHFDKLPEDHMFLISGERRHEILNLNKQLFIELTKNAGPNTELCFRILAENLLISITNASLFQSEQTLLINLAKLRGSRISDGHSGEVIEIPLAD